MNRSQFAPLWLPFGRSRYPTDACDILAAMAACGVANMMGVETTAQSTRCKTERREIFVDF